MKFIFILFLLGTVNAATPCKNQDYSRLKNGKCYRLMKTATDYQSAVGGCRLTNGKLAVIHSYEDNTEVGVWSAGWSAPEVWIGLVCPTLGTCKWQDGTDLDYTNFDDTPPNLNKGTCFYMEAGKIDLTKYNPWQNDDCTAQRNFICESTMDDPIISTIAPTTPPISQACGSYESWNGACYSVGRTRMSQNDAELACNADGGHLVSIHDVQTNDYVYSLLQARGVDVAAWIGLRRLSNGVDMWTDGTKKDFDMVPTGLLIPTPSSLSISVTDQLLPRQWIPEASNATLSYICRRPSNF
ncbi:unnamed protein product, partial [Mesorhabditis belari]|uniref:C-type lectin domain-containing protein n=1 Tax=Mesorhabditis belari TaxID=2138241 RepID=A0AAF3J9U5_9BILA